MIWRILLILWSILTVANAFSFEEGDAIGNGGDGVYIDIEKQQFYLLDLVERGNHLDPFFNDLINVDLSYLDRVNNAFSNIPVSSKLIARKLTEIKQIDFLLADKLLEVMEMYQWDLVSWPLRNVTDEGTWIGLELFQIAIRSQTKVIVQKALFEALDTKNRVALIFHEAIYALMTPERYQLGAFVQRSKIARSINSLLFTTEFSDLNWVELKLKTKGYLPLKENLGFGVFVHANEVGDSAISYSKFVVNNENLLENIHYTGFYKRACLLYEIKQPDEARVKKIVLQLRPIDAKLRFSSYSSVSGILDYVHWSFDEKLDEELLRKEFPVQTNDTVPYISLDGNSIYYYYSKSCSEWVFEYYRQFLSKI